MPFGPYSDFDDCVRHNQNLEDPQAYCASLHHQATGKWPSEVGKVDLPLVRIHLTGEDFVVAKFDDEKQFVFGWANISVRTSGKQVTDSQGHQIDPADLELGAYNFVLNYREVDERHKKETKGYLIESFFPTPEKLVKMGLSQNALPQGWWVGFHLKDRETYLRAKSGENAMFSIEGIARLEEVK